MNWEALSAICAALVIVGGVFLWVVTMVVESRITKAINGFRTSIALQSQEIEMLKSSMERIEKYAHETMHDRINRLADIQLDAFNAGLKVGRAGHGEA